MHNSARSHGSVHTHIGTSSSEYLDFMARVLTAAIADRLGKGRRYFPGWRGTWLQQWLSKRAKEYRFYALESEEWHWDYR